MREEEFPTERSADSTTARASRSVVLRGVLPGDATFARLSGSRSVLGRGAECDVRLERARVSRQHAEIVRQGPLVTIRDLDSTNGTNVDGRRIDHASIGPGSVIRIGEWLGVVEEFDAGEDDHPFAELAPGLFGGAMLARLVRTLALAAASTVPVLLLGKTGTGKERFARALHHLSSPDLPFEAINCAALPPTLAEAELFGYRKGAFTGAEQNYAGKLRGAGQGILFLDEVADLPLPVQAKLLRALDTGEIAALGEASGAHFTGRVIAASQEPLAALVERGLFRQDLAARLAGITLELPALGERRSDIPALFDTFLHEHSGGTAPPVSVKLYECLCLHAWPGNVRELELLARQLLALHGLEPVLRRRHLPELLRNAGRHANEGAASADDRNQSDVEKLESALKRAGGNVRAAAELAGISRQRAYRLVASRRLRGVASTTHRGRGERRGED